MEKKVAEGACGRLLAPEALAPPAQPPASLENTLDELPPGQQAISTSPMKNTGCKDTLFTRHASGAASGP